MSDPLIITHSYSQLTFPGVGDIDDCVVVATCQAAHALGLPIPTAPAFRKAAGVPDKPGPTPMSVVSAEKACNTLWPTTRTVMNEHFSWHNFGLAMEGTGRRPASCSVLSGALPARLQFGFRGDHQVCVFFQDQTWWLVNPLQPEGTPPHVITATELHTALGSFAGGGNVAAVLFPPVPVPIHVPSCAEQLATAQADITLLQAQVRDLTGKLTADKEDASKIVAR